MDNQRNTEHNSDQSSAPDPADETPADPWTPAPVAHGTGTRRSGRVQRQLARRRQRERIIGILIGVLGIVVLVIAFLALRNPHHAATAAGTDTHQSTPQTVAVREHRLEYVDEPRPVRRPRASRAPSDRKPLIVLNQTTTADLAQQAAQRFKRAGWQVSRPRRVTRTTSSRRRRTTTRPSPGRSAPRSPCNASSPRSTASPSASRSYRRARSWSCSPPTIRPELAIRRLCDDGWQFHNRIAPLIQRGRGTGPTKPRQPRVKQALPAPTRRCQLRPGSASARRER